MANLARENWSQTPDAGDLRVGIIGLGPGGLGLARTIARRYPVCAFDHTLEAHQDIPGDILWTAYPNDLCVATHIVIADPYSRHYSRDDSRARLNDLLWAASIVRGAVCRRTGTTIIMASVMPQEGTAKMLLQEFHDQGHRVGIAPQVS